MFQLSDDQPEPQIQPWSEPRTSQNHTTRNKQSYNTNNYPTAKNIALYKSTNGKLFKLKNPQKDNKNLKEVSNVFIN